MKKLLIDKRFYFLLSIFGVFVFSLAIQTNAQTGGGSSGCSASTTYMPRNYAIDKTKTEDCSYCSVTGAGAGVSNPVYDHGVQIGVTYSQAKLSVKATTVSCKYLPNDVNAYCSQLAIVGAPVTCPVTFVPSPGYTGSAPGGGTSSTAGGTSPGTTSTAPGTTSTSPGGH